MSTYRAEDGSDAVPTPLPPTDAAEANKPRLRNIIHDNSEVASQFGIPRNAPR